MREKNLGPLQGGGAIHSSPKHEQLREILLAAIESGVYKPGERLPSQNELAQHYGMSQHTVRESLASLEHEGLLYRIQGSGTYVAERKERAPVIALVLPHIHVESDANRISAGNIVPALVQSMEFEARRRGARVMLCLSGDEIEAERQNLLRLTDGSVDVVVNMYIGCDKNGDCLDALRAVGVPVVLVDRWCYGVDTDYVVTDNEQGAYAAVSRMLGYGLERIYFVTQHSPLETSVRDRIAGYERAMAEAGRDSRVIELSDPCGDKLFPEECMSVVTDALIDSFELPCGVMALNAHVLYGLHKGFLAHGIPHDRFVLSCFDDPHIPMDPDITLIKVIQPLAEIGRESIRLALHRAGTGLSDEYRHISLQPSIVERRDGRDERLG